MSDVAPIRLDAAEGIELLRGFGSRAELSIPDELREHSDCPEIRLESVFAEASPHMSLVLVHRVDLDAPRTTVPPTSVVKYSSRRYSVVDCESVKLGTAQHFRDFPGEPAGIRDQSEARYVESLHSYLAEWNPEALSSDWLQFADGSVTSQSDGSWFFCASLPPRTLSERAMSELEFGADCLTDLGDPAGFARELGSAFAQMTPAPPIALEEWFARLQDHALRTQSNFERVVHVRHGQVVYTVDHEKHIKHIPVQHRAGAVAFVKHPDYAHQREYRFAVSTIGKPAQDKLMAPVTEQIRSLATIVP